MNTKLSKINGPAVDAIFFTFVRICSTIIGIICIKLVAIKFSVEEYGVYSQAILIVSTVSSLLILGMSDGINFFYNKPATTTKSVREYVTTLFVLQIIIGSISGVVILIISPQIIDYFKDPALRPAMIWIAFQPLLANLLPMLQVLYISNNRTKTIAVRNFIISVLRLIIFAYACFFTHNIITIIKLLFICDLGQTIYFLADIGRFSKIFSVRSINFKLTKELLSYCIPISVFVLVNAIIRDSDKWIVSYFSDTYSLGLYTNASKVLPFDLILTSFAVVLSPIITKSIHSDKEKCQMIYSHYLNLGLIINSILVIPAIYYSKDLLLTLYSQKYLPALNIFRIYLIIDLIRFANVSLIFRASGHIKIILWTSLVSCLLNIVIGVIGYKILGLLGPAISSVIIMIASTIYYLKLSSPILDCNIFRKLDIKNLICVTLEITAIFICQHIIINVYNIVISPVLCFFISYIFTVGCVLVINKSLILKNMKIINHCR